MREITIRTDISDRAARLLGIVYGELGQLQQKAGTFELLVEDTGALAQLDITLSALRDALRGAGTKDFSTLETDVEALVAKDFATQTTLALIKLKTDNLDLAITSLRDALKGAGAKDFSTLETDLESLNAKVTACNTGAVDVIDRAARLLGIVYGNLTQLQQKAGTFELLVEDTGLHTNPRQYEKDNGFTSFSIARAGGVATAVWAVGVASINPVAGRTAGKITTVYTLELRNPNAAAQTAWLENGAGIVLSVVYELAPLDTTIIDYLAGKNFGNVNLFINASVNGVECQISGTEV